jgi:hypothetical protein
MRGWGTVFRPPYISSSLTHYKLTLFDNTFFFFFFLNKNINKQLKKHKTLYMSFDFMLRHNTFLNKKHR